jgi:hypothetical protein
MMSITDVLAEANITRILMVDDDLRETPTLADVNECAPSEQGNVESILQDPDHDATESLVDLLQKNGLPHATLEELFEGLANKDIREQCPEDLSKPYNDALKNLSGFQEPLKKIQTWIRSPERIEVSTWPRIRELHEDEFYDLLIVDYYLVDNQSTPTRAFIKKILEKHRGSANPLLVILMSSNKAGVTNDLSKIRDEVGASASRFRILVKPISTYGEPEPVVKERWLQALAQLANERALIKPIEDFIDAWKIGLEKATNTIVKRLYELDASAFAILSATASADSMSIEEYMADVLAKRVSAETEEHAEVSAHTLALQKALTQSASSVGPTINQGVEIKDAQHAIRRLMSDVVWHRPLWYQPQISLPNRVEPHIVAAPPEAEIAETNEATATENEPLRSVALAETVAMAVAPDLAQTEDERTALGETPAVDAEQSVDAGHPEANSDTEDTTGITEERLTWMKRNLRFGTVLREKNGRKRYFVNITQACDIQNVKFDVASAYHYLFVRGEKLPVDRVAVGEKVFESPYYAQSTTVDEFYSFHWNLRQPFTPSMTEVLNRLEDYSIEGQLRNESAYAVLTKFLSQASRVALLRMPKIYRSPVYILHKEQGAWINHPVDVGSEVYSSSWEKKQGIWCSQFQLDDAYRVVSTLKNADANIQAKSVAALGKSTQFDTSKKHAIKKLEGNRIYLARLKADADLEVTSVIQELTGQQILKEAKDDDLVVVVRSTEGFA